MAMKGEVTQPLFLLVLSASLRERQIWLFSQVLAQNVHACRENIRAEE